jgi:hypothetical protein
MRRLLPCVVSIVFAAAPILTEAASASDESKDRDRLGNCGTFLKDILDVLDNIPHDSLDKADCVVVIPSVLSVYGKNIPARDSTLETKTRRHRP